LVRLELVFVSYQDSPFIEQDAEHVVQCGWVMLCVGLLQFPDGERLVEMVMGQTVHQIAANR
jgi:hypothetical protein